MKVAVQTAKLDKLREMGRSPHVHTLRFGDEFCQQKLPEIASLKEAMGIADRTNKNFVYVTPRVSPKGLSMIKEHLDSIREHSNLEVVVSDFGLLRLLQGYPGLEPRLGRQLVYAPARCPWPSIGSKDIASSLIQSLGAMYARSRVQDLFYQTSLNYPPTVKLLKRYGVHTVELDWIEKSFKHYSSLAESGLRLSVHSHLVPVTVTRKCHMARFFAVKTPENCPKPCEEKTLLLKHRKLGIDLYLQGNTVYRIEEPSRNEMTELEESGVHELVVAVGSLTKIQNRHDLHRFVTSTILEGESHKDVQKGRI